MKMKKIIAVLRAMLADDSAYIPDVYGVQSFGANGLFWGGAGMILIYLFLYFAFQVITFEG